MKVLFINNEGGGFADYLEIGDGNTVEKFFSEKMSHGKAEDYLIRVNRQPVARDYVLHEGDQLEIVTLVGGG